MIPLLLACASGSPEVGESLSGKRTVITLEAVARGAPKITDIAFQRGHMVLATQPGRLLVVRDGEAREWVTLDVIAGSERGLLGIDFAPDYPTSGEVALSWTEAVAERTMSRIGIWKTAPGSDPGSAPLALDRLLFEVEQPWSNHNGGDVAYGPDGMLYVGFGDGGRANDPLGAGQDGKTPLGAMLRLDPRSPPPHVPEDNPFVGDPDVHDAIWATGLRNPWRFSFAPDGRLVVADVGQNTFEEVTFAPRGANLGWNHKEGFACFQRETCPGDFVDPILVYPRSEGRSITGGYVATTGPLRGRYVYGDFASGRIWSVALPETGAKADRPTLLGIWDGRWSTFGRDAAGQLYVGDYSAGVVYRLAEGP